MEPNKTEITQNSTDDSIVENEKKKQIRIEAELNLLLENLSSANTNTLRDKVAWILNNYPETRDSDIALSIKYWETFEPEIFSWQNFKPDDLFNLTRTTSITRERARIQNVYKLFLASPVIRKQRGKLEEEEKLLALQDKPQGYPTTVIYMDESGKNQENLIVGSLWFLESGKSILAIHKIITEWKKGKGFEKEFHFSEMSQMDLPVYKEMVTLFMQESPVLSFKLASLPTAGISNKPDALNKLFYHLIIRGIENEIETCRAVLPRNLQIWKDADEIGADQLLVAELYDQIMQASSNRFYNEISVSQLKCSNSSTNLFLQIADLFTASANRIINQPEVKKNHKSEFAEFFLDLIGVDKSFKPNDRIGDKVIHISI